MACWVESLCMLFSVWDNVWECVNDPQLKTTSSVVAATGILYLCFHAVVKTIAKSQIRTNKVAIFRKLKTVA
jgi:hypothetical protein